MTLLDTIREIERTARRQPAIRTVVANDIFRLNAMKDVRYGVFAWTQGQHSAERDRDYKSFAFTFYYADRLVDGERNEVSVQSAGIEILDNIIRSLDEQGFDITSWQFVPFNQRFADLCAGVYTNVIIRVPIGDNCAQDYED